MTSLLSAATNFALGQACPLPWRLSRHALRYFSPCNYLRVMTSQFRFQQHFHSVFSAVPSSILTALPKQSSGSEPRGFLGHLLASLCLFLPRCLRPLTDAALKECTPVIGQPSPEGRSSPIRQTGTFIKDAASDPPRPSRLCPGGTIGVQGQRGRPFSLEGMRLGP